jgi:CubicO group peptidase (beta-lactamase class C family)
VGDILEKVIDTGLKLDQICHQELYSPLGLGQTFFRHLDDSTPASPTPGSKHSGASFASTEFCPGRDRLITGEVHDENAYLLRGVPGHAGLFSTAHDLEHIAQACSWSKYHRRRILPSFAADSLPAGDSKFKSCLWLGQTPARRSCGGSLLDSSLRTYGLTGTSIWIDPDQEIYVILLTNRIHPTRQDRGFLSLRPPLHDLIVDALQQMER